MNHYFAVFFVLLALPPISMAGKAEREFLKNEVNPAVKAAEEAWKTACGCPLKINLKSDDYQVMGRLKSTANNIKENIASYCTDVDSKKAVCQMKELNYEKGKANSFSFSGSTGVAVTDGDSYHSVSSLTQVLDK